MGTGNTVVNERGEGGQGKECWYCARLCPRGGGGAKNWELARGRVSRLIAS